MSDDYGVTVDTGGAVDVGGVASGVIETSGDRDWFAVELEAGRTYTIDLRGSPTGDGTLRDPYLYGIRDADGALISGTANDDGGYGYNSRVTFTPTEAGTYYIEAGAYHTRQGTYEVEVTDITPPSDDFADTAATTGTIEVGGSVTGEIGAARDFDWFALDAVAGRTYVIDLEGSETDAGTLANPRLRGLFDADGNRLPGTTWNDNGGEGLNSRMTWTATETGTVYVVARGHGDHTGTYTLSVADVTPQEQGAANAAPAFGQDGYAFELAENAAGDAVPLSLGLVRATDPDGDPLTYSIGAGDPDGLFAIDAETGELSYVGAGEDYESGTTSHELTVRASDGALHGDVTVTVNVSDVEGDEEDRVSVRPEASVSEPEDSDLPATTSTTGVVAVGGSATGEVEYERDRDWFAVTLQEGRLYRIDLEGSRTGAGTLSDPYLKGVYSASGNLIEWTPDDDDGRGDNSRVLFAAEADATYYVAAGAWFNEDYPQYNGVGTYTLSVSDVTDRVEDDFAVGTGTSGMVEVGGSVTGEIEYERDRDWFAVTLEAGRLYRIDLEGYDGGSGTLYNPYLLGVYDAVGMRLPGTEDDDSGRGANSRRFVMVETDGTYYVGACAVGERSIPDEPEDRLGTYTLSVRDVTNRVGDDFAAGTETSGRVEVGGSVTGEVDYRSDRDWFAVTLEAGRYQIKLEGSATDAGTLSYVDLYGVYNADGELIPGTMNDSTTDSRWDGQSWVSSSNKRLYFTASEDDSYYVSAGAQYHDVEAGDSALGTYTLSVEELI